LCVQNQLRRAMSHQRIKVKNFRRRNTPMSLQRSPDGHIDRKVLQAIAGAIRSIETVTGTIVGYGIGKDDAELLCSTLTGLWSILETNGYTIDIDTNRLRRAIP
jgi:hypothetical protein